MVESCQRGLCVNSCLTAFHVVVSLQACNFGAVLRHVVLEACHGCCSLGSNPLQETARTVIWISLRALRSQCHAINPDLACSRTVSGIRVAQTVFSLYFFSQEKKKKLLCLVFRSLLANQFYCRSRLNIHIHCFRNDNQNLMHWDRLFHGKTSCCGPGEPLRPVCLASYWCSRGE